MKVFIVKFSWKFEEYHDTEIYVYHKYEKAKAKFEEIKQNEITTSWINNLSQEDWKEFGEDTSTTYYAYDSHNYYETEITLIETEVR